ncbi:MAG: hypothetical protein R3C53_24710 [Pirellulaceae bacterium]
MGFRFFGTADGKRVTRVHRSRNNVPEGNEWEFSYIEGKLLELAGISGPDSPTADATAVAMEEMRRIVQQRLGLLVIELIMANGSGVMQIQTTQKHTLWADTVKIQRFYLSGSSGKPVVRQLFKFLDKSDMNHWGYVHEILTFLELFRTGMKSGAEFYANISLTK